jgi:hypothetical protein
MFNPWFGIARDAVRLGIEAQSVVALRLARLAVGGPSSSAEARRMMAEKLDALAKLQVAAALTVCTRGQGASIARKALGIYGKRVRANRRRLLRK